MIYAANTTAEEMTQRHHCEGDDHDERQPDTARLQIF